jgi:acetylornithine deacetylase/succinyl-diaminopimelate desuccinylase-like protein
MNFDERFQRAAEPIKDQVTRFLPDPNERPRPLTRRERDGSAQRWGDAGRRVRRGHRRRFRECDRTDRRRPVHIVLDSHEDVVDTSDLSLWKSDPFEARIENGSSAAGVAAAWYASFPDRYVAVSGAGVS